MDINAEAAARAALALAAVYQRSGCDLDASVQDDIISELHVSMQRDEAVRRRDDALRNAFQMLGQDTSVKLLFESLRKFETRIWPSWRWVAQPPEDASPYRKELFFACLAASATPLPDSSLNLPGERQLRRIVTSPRLNVTQSILKFNLQTTNRRKIT